MLVVNVVARQTLGSGGEIGSVLVFPCWQKPSRGDFSPPSFGKRLIAGVYSLPEINERMRNLCLLMKKVGMQCTYDDAQVLAQYEGLTATNGYAKRLKARMPE
jgi:hypothetical protein